MAIEEVIQRAVMLKQTIEIEYCTRSGNIFHARSLISSILNITAGVILKLVVQIPENKGHSK